MHQLNRAKEWRIHNRAVFAAGYDERELTIGMTFNRNRFNSVGITFLTQNRVAVVVFHI